MTREILRRRRLTGLPKPKAPKERTLSCCLMLNKRHALALADLLEALRTSHEPGENAFDKTPLGEVLQALKSGGRIG